MAENAQELLSRIKSDLKVYAKKKFNLIEDQNNFDAIEVDIASNLSFTGANLWVLLIAILVASIGLNMNSNAVIIGAMLISPLMGPVIGVGHYVAINDFELLKESLKQYGFASMASLLTSGIYFYLTPIDDAQSEILSRISPTIWDVFIAFLGGMAGMIGLTRQSRGNVIPGVAISTALMPPLCTAGYGLAQGSFEFLLGAIYLFFINSVFIAFGTFFISRILDFPNKKFIDPLDEKKVKRIMLIFILITIIPSTYTAKEVVSEAWETKRINNFVDGQIKGNGAVIINKDINWKTHPPRVDVQFFSTQIDEKKLSEIRESWHHEGPSGVELHLSNVGASDLNSQELKKIMAEYQNKNDLEKKEMEDKLKALQETSHNQNTLDENSLKKEVPLLYSSIEEVKVYRHVDKEEFLIELFYKKSLRSREKNQLEAWLKERVKKENIRFIYSLFSPLKN